MRSSPAAAALLACLVATAACTAPTIEVPFADGAADTPTPPAILPSPPPAPNTLVVCLAAEPDTFYLYDSPNASAQTLLPALYDGPFDVLGYQYRPVILEAVPSAEAGSVRLEAVSLRSGDLYFNPETMLPETLAPGKAYLPAGCTSPDCMRRFEGGQTQMDRQIAEFRLLPDLMWSDGTPLTAHDSVFSFQLDADPDTPSLKDQVYRTAAYEAVDDRTIRWTGIPGYSDPELASDFWTPLPEHVLGEIPPADLPREEAARTMAMGWGPYRLDRWTPGESLEFVRNPNYRRQSEGLPAFDRLEARIIGGTTEGAIQQILTGECDILEEALLDESTLALLQQISGDERLQWTSTPGVVLERLDFDTAPASERAPILAEAEVRRALAGCIDREALIERVVSGLTPVPAGMIAADHPLGSLQASSIGHDPLAAGEALDSLGWVDDDGQPATPRVAQGVSGVAPGTPLSLSLLFASESGERELAQGIADDLARCGVRIALENVPAESLYASWPDGPAFGRDFDLVLWPWLGWVSPACELFTTDEIPSATNLEGSNASGFSDASYDAACARMRLGPFAGDVYAEAVRETQAILDQAMPTLPLLQWPRLLIGGGDVCGLSVDATAPLLWKLEEITRGPSCAG